MTSDDFETVEARAEKLSNRELAVGLAIACEALIGKTPRSTSEIFDLRDEFLRVCGVTNERATRISLLLMTLLQGKTDL